jgi:hypothetical protein
VSIPKTPATLGENFWSSTLPEQPHDSNPNADLYDGDESPAVQGDGAPDVLEITA